jgi:arylsulfatase A-like enzyme
MGSSKKDWPLGLGYDRFYGFVGAETNQWYPDLAEDNHYIDQPYGPEDGYHLSKDLADKALEFIRDAKQSEPDKPWYLWFCPAPTTPRITRLRSTSRSTRGASTTATKPTACGFCRG